MTRYNYPPEVEATADTLRRQAARRRAALKAAGCSTYALGLREGRDSIVCLCCGLGSMVARDIQYKFCGFCGAYHSDWKGADE